jgi:hypothetical protein
MFKFSYIILFVSLLSCSGSDLEIESPNNPDDKGEFEESINYQLKDSSLSIMPYQGRTKVIFVDSLSNTLEFSIEEKELETNNFSTYNKELDKCEPPSWTEESKEIIITNDSLDLTFHLELKTDLDRSGSGEKKFRDVLFLWTVSHPAKDENTNSSEDSDNIIESRHSLFQCTVDPRTSQYSSISLPADSLMILGRTFYKVYRPELHGIKKEYSIFFNFEFSILGFRDFQSKAWRFSHYTD